MISKINLDGMMIEKKEYILYSVNDNEAVEYVKSFTVSSYRGLVRPTHNIGPQLNIEWTTERHKAERVSLEDYIRVSNLSDIKLYTFPKIEPAYPEPEYYLPLIWCLRFPNEAI